MPPIYYDDGLRRAATAGAGAGTAIVNRVPVGSVVTGPLVSHRIVRRTSPSA